MNLQVIHDCSPMQRFHIVNRLLSQSTTAAFHPVRPRFYANMSAPKAAETDTQAENVANTTGVTGESIRKALEQGIGAQHVAIEDLSGMNVPTHG